MLFVQCTYIHTTAYLLNYLFQNLTEDNKACFCGGLVEFNESLNSVEALLCMKDANVHANEEEKRQGNSNFGYNIAFSANRADSCCLGSNSRVRFETTITSAVEKTQSQR